MDSTYDLPSVYSSSDRGEKKKKKKFSSNNVSRLHFVSLSFYYMGVYRDDRRGPRHLFRHVRLP